MNIRHLVSIGVVLAVATAAQAQSIGINFVGLQPDSQTLSADDTAGVSEIPQSHWNNATINNDDANGFSNHGELTTVVDRNGKVVKDMTVTIKAAKGKKVYPANCASWGFTGSNLTLQSGDLHPQAHITITNIPYKQYMVIAYASCGNNAGLGKAMISVANDAKGKVDSTGTYFYKLGWTDGKFVQTLCKTLDEAKESKGANYIRFVGNTASEITIEWDGLLGGGWTGISGLQIVEVSDR